MLAQAPSHLQSEVHLNPPVTHLHLSQSVLHVQLWSMAHDLLASSNTVHSGTRRPAEFLFQPQSMKGGRQASEREIGTR